MDGINNLEQDLNDPQVLESLRVKVRDSLTRSYKAGYEKGRLDQQLEDGELCVQQADLDVIKKLAYDQGAQDVWELVRRILNNNPVDDLVGLFSTESLGWILKNFTAAEALEKLTGKDIKVGDEVRNKYLGEQKYIVTGFEKDGAVLCTFGGVQVKVQDVEKTGRHFDQVDELLQELEEDSIV